MHGELRHVTFLDIADQIARVNFHTPPPLSVSVL
jgi:hypothetical protein